MEEQAVFERVVDHVYAVLLVGDDERECIVPVAHLPQDAKPGDWLRVRIEDDEIVAATVDAEETRRVKQRIETKLDRLRNRGRRLDRGDV